MLLGLLLHAACSYTTFPMQDAWLFKDERTSHGADALLLTIHTFRMPVFMVLAGFFAALLADRRGVGGLILNRTQRVLIPFVVAFVLVMPLVKWAAFYAQSVGEGLAAPVDEGLRRALRSPFFSSLGHLWFLYDL
jgi:glucans biosynthesis protein C